MEFLTPVVLVGPGSDLQRASQIMAQQRPHLQFCTPDSPLAQQAEVALCWNPPPGSLGQLPQLKLIHSVGAGAERIVAETSRSPDVPICRIVDPDHRQGMVEYVLWAVLHYHRQMDAYLRQRVTTTWLRHPQKPAADTVVGVMGLGTLGKAAATQLASLGFNTRGWSRRATPLQGVNIYSEHQFQRFLDGIDILICLLPLTPATQGVLCTETFVRLAEGAVIINCGRGGHLVEADLLNALQIGRLRGAVLDVFVNEPLPATSALWTHPAIVATPHIASSASAQVIAQQILDNIDRLNCGEPLLNVVDPMAGY